MEVSTNLINRLFRDVLKSGEAIQVSESLPDNLAFELPLLPATTVIGAIARAELSYDFIFKSPATAAELQAFYLNTLRILGWERWYAPDGSNRDPLGIINAGNLGQHPLYFCHPQKRYFLELRTISEVSETRLHLKVVSSIYQPGVEPTWRQRPTNTTPMPVLIPPPGTKVKGGQSGGNHLAMHQVRTLQSPHSLAHVIDHFTQQLYPIAQLEERNTSAELAYSLWSLTDAAGESWQLFFSIAATSQVQQYTSILRVDSLRGITRAQPWPYPPASERSFTAEYIATLLETLHPETPPKLHWGKLPSRPVPRLPLPTQARILGSLSTNSQWRIFLDMPGSAQQILADLTQQLRTQGWELAHSPSPFEDIGFEDSGFYPLVPAHFYHPEYETYPLSVWSRPAQTGWVDVELAINEEEEPFSRLTDSTTHERERPQYPTVALALPPHSVVYAGDGAYHPDRFRTGVYLRTALSLDRLMAHYNAQLTEGEWVQLAHQGSNKLGISSWMTESDRPGTWHCLLWVIKTDSNPDTYSAHLQLQRLEAIV